MEKMSLSIIMPVYNAEPFLAKSIESILKQSYQNFELILVDDGSQDGSASLCDAYAEKDKRIRVIHKENAGVSEARNDGICAAQGEFIAFVDADDFPSETMYERLLQAQSKFQADAVYCGFKRVYADHEEEETFAKEKLYVQGEIRDLAHQFFSAEIFGPVWRGLYKKSAIGALRFNPDLHYAEDLNFNLWFLTQAKRVAVIPDVLYNYNKANENSICAKTERDPDFRYTASLQNQLQVNEIWKFPLDENAFYMVYVDMMYQFLVHLLYDKKNFPLVERYLTEGFFSTCCQYDKYIPFRRRIVGRCIRKRHFRLAVWIRKAEDVLLKIMHR